MSSVRHIIGWLFCISIFLLLPSSALAASPTLSSAPASIQSSDEYPVTVTLNINASDGTVYYLRGAFAKQGSSNYCGLTKNGSDWFSGPYTTNEGWKNFLPVTIQNNSWTGTLTAKVDSADSGCAESGTYTFKV